MTATSDPRDPAYLAEADLRGELARVFDVCHGCRRCADRCVTFPTLFEMLDGRAAGDSGRMTPDQQDRVAATCFHCGRCVGECPYSPERGGDVDVPATLLRAVAVRRATGMRPASEAVAARWLGRSAVAGRLGGLLPGLADAIAPPRPGTLRRRVLRSVTGISAARALPGFARRRGRDGGEAGASPPACVVVPTCIVEHHVPAIVDDATAVIEHLGARCSVARVGCCGAPSLHSGDLGRSDTLAGALLGYVVDQARAGRDVVVAQPLCAAVIAEAARRAGGETEVLVARHVSDLGDHLARSAAAIDDLAGARPSAQVTPITFHASAPSSAASRSSWPRLLAGLGPVTVVDTPTGIGSPWGLRAAHDPVVDAMAGGLAAAIDATGPATVASDGVLDGAELSARTGVVVVHPVALLAQLIRSSTPT